MLGFVKKKWNAAGVGGTMRSAGMDKESARLITNALPDDFWELVSDCTKNLNQQCTNLCNSLFAIHAFESLYAYSPSKWFDVDLLDSIKYVAQNLSRAIDYQIMMGHKEAIAESEKRFEYVCNNYLDDLLVTLSVNDMSSMESHSEKTSRADVSTSEIPKQKPKLESPVVEFSSSKNMICMKCLTEFVSKKTFCAKCGTGGFVSTKA